jgi:GTP cyclohydrolase I
MSMRGVEKQNSFAVTSAMLGAFRDNQRTRMEFLELMKVRGLTTSSMVPPPGLACVSD